MSDEKKALTPISTLGEFGLIDRISKNFNIRNKNTIKGIGDDAAVIDIGQNKVMLISTDMLVEGVHFDLSYVPLKHLGYKAAVVNFSDIYAMNGNPSQITVSIALSSRFSVEAVDELYEGIRLACDKYNVDMVGGDTTSSVSGLIISISVIGFENKDKVSYRGNAKEEDLVCVTGNLGSAYMGLQLLEREKEVFKTNPNFKPEFSGHEYILQRQLKPEARKDIVAVLEKHKIVPNAMIDISDGLSSEIIHICESSKKGCVIFEEKIPIDQSTADMADEMGIEPLVAALNGGEDYELLFTIGIDAHKKIAEEDNIRTIGYITKSESGCNLRSVSGPEIELKAMGWNAIKK